MTHDFTGGPILLVRRQDGTLGANVCRHRGARIAKGSGNGSVFRRPHHVWDGRTEKAKKYSDKNFELLTVTVEQEDFPMAVSSGSL
jgi:phenylpropionate dioxygenase-like ring-hydroxylating dioxygenase large terminal subunit